jgi:hypothetical protein
LADGDTKGASALGKQISEKRATLSGKQRENKNIVGAIGNVAAAKNANTLMKQAQYMGDPKAMQEASQ